MKEGERAAGFREGADPTLVYFKGKYYLFVSMSAGFWYSDDLLHLSLIHISCINVAAALDQLRKQLHILKNIHRITHILYQYTKKSGCRTDNH